MADLSITAANVIAATASIKKNGTAGATITAGQVVYLDATAGKYKLADADNVPAAGFSGVQIALNGASDNQPITVANSGDIAMGSVFTAGTAYYLSGTPGGIAPVADVATGDDVVLIGVAASATTLKFRPIVSGVTL